MYITNKSKLAVAALLMITILSGCSDNKTSIEYIAEAKAAFNKGENSIAIISLKNVLKTEKNNVEARFLLGQIYAKQGLWFNAEKELSRAKNAGFSELGIDALLIKVAYRLDDTDYLKFAKDIQNENSELAKVYLAILALKNGKVEEGRAIFDEIILVNNDPDVSKLALAWDAFLNAKYMASLEQLKALETLSVIKEDIIELRVVNLVAQKKHEAAAEQLEMFLALHPQSHIHRLQLAEQYVKYRNYSKAEKNADLLLSHYKQNVILNRIKAEIKFNAKEYTLAKEFAEISLRNSDDVLSKVIAGMSAYQLGQYESSHNYLNAASGFFSEGHPVNQILNSLSTQLKNSNVANDPLLPDVVLSLIQSGNYKQARTALEKSSESSLMNDGVIDFRLGLLKMADGDPSFTDDFQRAISSGFEGVEPKVLLAQQYLVGKEYTKVLDIADSLLSTQHTTALLLKGSVFLEKLELEEATSIYEQILANEPEHMGALFKLSETLFKANKPVKSMDYLKKIYSLSSSNLYAVKRLFVFSLEAPNKKHIEEFLLAEMTADKKNINRHIVLAEFYLLHKEFEQALTIASRYLLKTPKQFEVSLLKVRTLLLLNRTIEAKADLLALEQSNASHPEVIKYRAQVLNVEGKKAEAIKVIEGLRASVEAPLNDELLLILSTLYIENVQILNAEKSLNMVRNKQGMGYLRLEGKMALIKGNSPLAIKSLTKVYQVNPSQIIALELAQALQNVGEIDEAIRLLEELIAKADSNKLVLIKYKLAELSENKYPMKAERYYKQLLVDTKGSVATLNNIAWFYHTQQRNEEGKGYASQAVKKAPELAAVHNTLGVILLELNELSQGTFHLQASVKLEPKNDKYKIWLAKGFFVAGNVGAAEKLRSAINFDELKPSVKALFNSVFE